MPSLKEWLAIDKGIKFFQIIKHHGGWWNSIAKLLRQDDLKIGTLVGVDKYGNRYYENNEMYFHGRNRWVEYTDRVYLDYDGSQIPAEWHGWLHYSTDFPPTIHPPVEHKWMISHTENLTGTDQQYVPYSTVRPKIQSWNPSQQKKLPTDK